jgi:hypothetical protein
MSELLRTSPAGAPSPNPEDILEAAARGDPTARGYFASLCLIGKYIENPVVRDLAKQVLREKFNPTSLVSCLPPREELSNVSFKPGSLLVHLNEGRSMFRDCLESDTPLRLRILPEVCELRHLGTDPTHSVKAGIEALNRFKDALDSRTFPATDLTVAMLVEGTQTVLEFEAALPQGIDRDSPLAILACSAARGVLHLCLAAAIVRVGCNKLKVPDNVLKKILTDDSAEVQRDPWAVVNVALFQKCRDINGLPGVELLGALNDQHLCEILIARDGLTRANKQIAKERTALDKRDAKRKALRDKCATIGLKSKMEPDAFTFALEELHEAMRSSGSKYAREEPEDIEARCISLLERVITLPTADMQCDMVVSWIEEIKKGASVQQLTLPRVP